MFFSFSSSYKAQFLNIKLLDIKVAYFTLGQVVVSDDKVSITSPTRITQSPKPKPQAGTSFGDPYNESNLS